MSSEQLIQWGLIAAGLAGGAAAFILSWRDRQGQASAYHDLSKTVTGLSAEVRQLRADLWEERGKRQRLEVGVGILINQLRKAGIEPEWTPPEIEG